MAGMGGTHGPKLSEVDIRIDTLLRTKDCGIAQKIIASHKRLSDIAFLSHENYEARSGAAASPHPLLSCLPHLDPCHKLFSLPRTQNAYSIVANRSQISFKILTSISRFDHRPALCSLAIEYSSLIITGMQSTHSRGRTPTPSTKACSRSRHPLQHLTTKKFLIIPLFSFSIFSVRPLN